MKSIDEIVARGSVSHNFLTGNKSLISNKGIIMTCDSLSYKFWESFYILISS